MFRHLAVIGLVGALVAGVCVGCAEDSAPDTAAATALILEWAAGWNSDDREAIAGVFAFL